MASHKTKFIPFEEFSKKTTPCKNGRRCEDKTCVYLHNMKTRMCTFGDRCRRRAQCTYAHSTAELYVPECRFGARCNNKKCTFSHPKPVVVATVDPVVINDPKKLEKANFPKFVEEQPIEAVIDYSEMKSIVDHVDTLVIASKEVDDIIEEYNSVRSFNKLTIKM